MYRCHCGKEGDELTVTGIRQKRQLFVLSKKIIILKKNLKKNILVLVKFPLIQNENDDYGPSMGKKYISITKGAFDVLLPRFGFGDVDQAAIVNDRFGKRALRVIAVGYAVYDEPPKEITSEALEKSSLNWHD